MATEPQIQEFKTRFTTVLKDLKDNGQNDPEAMWLIGSLADRIVSTGGKKDWPELKAALTSESYDSLIKQFEEQGNALHAKGNEKAAYAVQAMAVSLVASRIPDPDISAGNELMDALINNTIKFFRNNEAAKGKLN